MLMPVFTEDTASTVLVNGRFALHLSSTVLIDAGFIEDLLSTVLVDH